MELMQKGRKERLYSHNRNETLRGRIWLGVSRKERKLTFVAPGEP
jgi:hypothetical protein